MSLSSSTAPPTSRSGTGVPPAILLAIAAVTALSPLATDLYLAAFPALGVEFATGNAAVQLTLTMFMVGFGVGQYVFGALSDRWGRRWLLLGGTAVCLAASIGAALAPSIAVLWAMRLLQGLGAATGAVLARAVVSDLATGVRRAQQMSLMMVIQGLAPIVAPVLGSALADPIGWRGIMWVLAGVSAAVLVGLICVLPETLPAAHRMTAPLGRVLLSPLSVLTSARFAAFAVALMATFGTLMAYVSGSSFVLQGVFGLGTVAYGLVFAVNAVTLAVVSGLNARLVGRWAPEHLSKIGGALVLLGSVGALVDALAAPNLVLFVSFVTLAAAGMGLCLANLLTLALNCLPATRQGSGSAVIGAGQALIAALVSPLVGLGTDSAAPTALVMTACALLVVGGVSVATKLPARATA